MTVNRSHNETRPGYLTGALGRPGRWLHDLPPTSRGSRPNATRRAPPNAAPPATSGRRWSPRRHSRPPGARSPRSAPSRPGRRA